MTQQVAVRAAVAAAVIEEVKRDIPIVSMATEEIFGELKLLKEQHASTHAMASDVFHRSMDLVLELLTRHGPHTPEPSSEAKG